MASQVELNLNQYLGQKWLTATGANLNHNLGSEMTSERNWTKSEP
jgi:hypothetical protein